VKREYFIRDAARQLLVAAWGHGMQDWDAQAAADHAVKTATQLANSLPPEAFGFSDHQTKRAVAAVSAEDRRKAAELEMKAAEESAKTRYNDLEVKAADYVAEGYRQRCKELESLLQASEKARKVAEADRDHWHTTAMKPHWCEPTFSDD